uniref:uncharacterized protein LOC124016378 isoform X2 n=1 Tax=Oncorhynchus gorbuscha TaxID=8017 RepID=UPI001EAECB46|nr:uncharacterized protein LOC124016378 isoform X2 [Oncorhynchus gorbuscha]
MCNAKRRLEWCKDRRHWTLEQWKPVLWSDEVRFSIWTSDGLIWFWQMPRDRYLSQCIGANYSLQLSLAVSEEVPFEQQQQEWSTRLGQEDPEPTQIKEEQEELCTSQEKEKLQGMEADIIEFKFTPV